MALTQISTGGIKDDAVTDAKLPANSVGNSEMKDDAVGVAELSATGTASSSTFLRGDNSWVTPTDTNTQVGGATGVDFNDDVKARWGTGNDLEAYHSDTGHHSYITHSGAGKLHIASTGDDAYLKSSENVALMVNDTEIGVYVIKDGKVGLYHDGTEQCYTSGNGLAFPSGKGIDFSATSDGGATTPGELLDDYEEGTFTPTIGGWSGSGTGTYTHQLGRYTKVGNLVTVWYRVTWTNLTGASGVLCVQNLPFSASNSPDWNNTSVVGAENVDISDPDSDGIHLVGHQWASSSSSILYYATRDNNTWISVGIDTSGTLYGTAQYPTNA